MRTAHTKGMSKLGIYAVALVALIGGLSAVADALVVTDYERLEDFSEAVTGKVSDRRIDSALRYTEPETQTVQVVTLDRHRTFDDANADRLPEVARDALAPLAQSHLRVVQESIQVDGEEGRVALRLHTSQGMANVAFNLRLHEDRWLVRRVLVN